ncbi:MAG: hypothetical protein WC294_00225 [Methanoregula sp.]|jgi:hypothetical protein
MKPPLHYLKISLSCFAVGIYAASFIGCASSPMPLVCRHQAVPCALKAGEIYGRDNVGVAVGVAGGIRARHAQAYYIKDGKITWLSNNGQSCETSERDWFDPEQYLTINQFINEPWW